MGILQQQSGLKKFCCKLQGKLHHKLINDMLVLLYNRYRSEHECTEFYNSKHLHD